MKEFDDISEGTNKSRNSKDQMAIVNKVLTKAGSNSMGPYHTHKANWTKIT